MLWNALVFIAVMVERLVFAPAHLVTPAPCSFKLHELILVGSFKLPTTFMNMKIRLRQETPADYLEVEALIEAAFEDEAFSDQSEHHLVRRLRQSEAFIPELSIVACLGEQILGHILLSLIEIRNEEQTFPSLALAPVSVLPAFQKQGIGGGLINEAHKRARHLGHHSVVLLGHSEYYPRFGYQKAAHFDIRLPFDVPAENCMAVELQPGALEKVSGVVVYPAVWGLDS